MEQISASAKPPTWPIANILGACGQIQPTAWKYRRQSSVEIVNKWILICARRLNLTNGQFGGVVYGTIEIEGMAERIAGKPLRLNALDTIVLSDDAMHLIARYINKKQDMEHVGQRISVPPVDDLLQSGADDGFFVASSPIDQNERFYYFQRIKGQPFNLLVGLASDDAMSGWRREVAIAGITTLVLALLISVGSYLSFRAQMRRVGLVAKLQELNAKLATLSTTDGLTGLANRRRFDELFVEEWKRGTRNRRPLALAMIDVDYFKKYNDRYGHQRGDECLRIVAEVLRQGVHRAGDLVARYGGEEFVFLGPATEGTNALQLVDAMRSALEALAVSHDSSPWGHVTMSIGVAAADPNNERDPETLIARADQALYAAKAQGRNRVVLAT